MEGSLEENILNCLRDAGTSLHLLDLWDQLDKRDLAIPIKSLEKVVCAMLRLGLLIQHDNQIDYPTYQPSFSQPLFHKKTLIIEGQVIKSNKAIQ